VKRILGFSKVVAERSLRDGRLFLRGARERRPRDFDTLRKASMVFVLSPGRSGTSYLTRILEHSESLWVEHAPRPILNLESVKAWQAKLSPDALAQCFLHARLTLLQNVARAGLRYVETNNRITTYLPGIAEMFPNANFIHLVRHPAEFVRSGMRRGYYDDRDSAESGHLFPAESDEVFGRWDEMSRVAKIAWYWNQIHQGVEDARPGIAAERFLEVRADALFSDPDTVLKILNFCGVAQTEQARCMREVGEPVNAQTSGKFPGFENWTAADRESLREFAPVAKAFGFDLGE